jgi:hypothetical protein
MRTSSASTQYTITYSPTTKLGTRGRNRHRVNAPYREAGRQNETVCDGVNQAGRNLDATAILRDLKPNIVKIKLGAGRYTMSHQRGDASSARRRARPRSFTSLASCCMFSGVITRPFPRARDALASSRVRRNSARCRSRSSYPLRDSPQPDTKLFD